MKTILLTILLLVGVNGFSQKTVYIYNLSSTNFDIGHIGTQNVSNPYPKLISAPSSGLITVPSLGTYVLVASPASTTVFPFYSPSSSPDIDNWTRILTSGGTPSTIPSGLAASVYGASQIIEEVKFQVGPNGSLGGNTFILNSSSGFSDVYYFGVNGAVSIDVINPITGLPSINGEGETYIIITD